MPPPDLTIEHDQLSSWVADVKRVFALDLPQAGGANCMGLGYLWIRFGAGDGALLSTSGGLKRPAYVQSTWLRSRLAKAADGTWLPIRYGWVPDLIEEMTLCK